LSSPTKFMYSNPSFEAAVLDGAVEPNRMFVPAG
jgi:hypothetical protein